MISLECALEPEVLGFVEKAIILCEVLYKFISKKIKPYEGSHKI